MGGWNAIALAGDIAAVDGGHWDPEDPTNFRYYSLLDVSDPESVTRVGLIELPDPAGHAAFLGDTLLLANRWHGLTQVNVADPTAPVVGRSILFDGSAAHALAATSSAAYIGSIARDNGLVAVDLADPTSPTPVRLLPGEQAPQDLRVDGAVRCRTVPDPGLRHGSGDRG